MSAITDVVLLFSVCRKNKQLEHEVSDLGGEFESLKVTGTKVHATRTHVHILCCSSVCLSVCHLAHTMRELTQCLNFDFGLYTNQALCLYTSDWLKYETPDYTERGPIYAIASFLVSPFRQYIACCCHPLVNTFDASGLLPSIECLLRSGGTWGQVEVLGLV